MKKLLLGAIIFGIVAAGWPTAGLGAPPGGTIQISDAANCQSGKVCTDRNGNLNVTGTTTLGSGFSFGGAYTVATIPAAPATGDVIVVTDGNTACDTTVGLGTSVSMFRYSGAAWVCVGDGGAGAIDITLDLNPALGGDLNPNGHAITGYLPSIDEDNMASNSAAYVPTQQSVKTYVDAVAALVDTDDEIIAIINASPSTQIGVPAGGTGAGTFTDGGLLVGAGTGPFEALAVGLTTQVLVGGGAGTNPAWGSDLPAAVTIGSAYIYRAGGTDVPNEDVADDITLTNITQITTRPITSLTATNWRLFYSADGGVPVELALGADGTYLRSNGAAVAPTFDTPGGSGDVTGVGDCASGACLDGTSDGGTYIRLYDGDSNYSQISAGNSIADLTFTFPTAYPGAANAIMVMSTAGVISTVAATTYLTDVVSDTTPQLGGNLDTNGFSITGLSTITASASVSPVSADSATLGTTALEWSDLYIADGGVIYGGADQDTSLTHVADTGWLINSTRQLQFGDSGTHIAQLTDGHLDLTADVSIDLNGAVVASSSIAAAGVITGLVNTSNTPASLTNFNSSYTISSAGSTSLPLPTAAAGYSVCIRQGQGRTDVLTATPASGDYIVKDGVRGTIATAISSSGAAGDWACFVSTDDTDWYMNYNGTWAE